MTKKLKLKIVLCFILLFTLVLTACSNGENKEQESNTSPDMSTSDNNGTEPPQNETTVVGEDEWYSIFAIENFSYNSVTTSEGSVIDEGKLLFDSDKCVVTDINPENNNIPFTFYRVRIGNKWYDLDMDYSSALSENNVGVCEYEVMSVRFPLASMFENEDIRGAFSKTTYDENKKAYLYSFSKQINYEEMDISFNYSYNFEFYIENQQLVKVCYEYSDDDITYSCVENFYDIGTTIIEDMPSAVFVGVPESISDDLHKWVLNTSSVVPAADCDGIGKATFICSDCQETLTVSYINGHSEETYESYRLAEGSVSCDDGVNRLDICKECNEVVQEMPIGNMHFPMETDCDLSGYDVCEDHKVGLLSCACGEEKSFYFDDQITLMGGGDCSCGECELRSVRTVISTETVENQSIQTVKISVYCGEQHIIDYTVAESITVIG